MLLLNVEAWIFASNSSPTPELELYIHICSPETLHFLHER